MKPLAAWIVAGLGLGAAVALSLPASLGPPPDTDMVHNLDQHRAAFARLIQMIREDKGLERVDVDWTRPDDPATVGVGPERIAEYRRLFAETHVARGFYSFHEATTIIFMAYASGLSVSGSSKSYLYSTAAPEELVDEPLDRFHRKRKVLVRRRIGENWYLEYEAS